MSCALIIRPRVGLATGEDHAAGLRGAGHQLGFENAIHAMGAHESAMLNWLGKEWDIAVRIEEHVGRRRLKRLAAL